ncbi:olfactory receptor 2D3-like [Leptodactylus fuscus]
MENSTSVPKEFHIWPFSFSTQSPAFILALFTVIYLLGVLLNVLIVTLIYLDKQLHSPMYLFLCNLSFVDICYTTTVIPKLLHMLSSGNHKVSFRQCFTQIFFFFLAAGTEDLLLFIMAYDRFTSYAKILQVIYQIKSRDGRKKAFSTCSSHLTVILLYYSTAALVYLLPSSKYSDILDQFFTLLYATVTPMVNPLIYSLRNKEVKTAVMKLLQFNPIMFLRSTFLS